MRLYVPVKIRTIDDAIVAIDVPEGADTQQIKDTAEYEALRRLPSSGKLRFAFSEAIARSKVYKRGEKRTRR